MPRPIKNLTQPLSPELQESILALLRSKFYNGEDRAEDIKSFCQDRRRLLNWVVRYPAGWLISRGVTIHGEAYRGIFVKVFIQAAAHVTSKVNYRPAYLRHVIQEYFKHHGDEIYEAAKTLRSITDRLILMASDRRAPAPDPVAELAAARRLEKAVAPPKRPAKAPVKEQLSLF
jgi:hypothetical protein